ncbi:MAG TPA: sugar ABC transporter substrate-binding protein [Nitrospirae bacterium]|nr:sugar ABC transporter substrate-binding protein [Nitrospirota bacterium]
MKTGGNVTRTVLAPSAIIFIILISFNVYAKDYVIGGGDSLQISVWGSPDLSIAAIVRPDGKISIPALGDIKASGLTAMELTDLLEKEMAKVVKTPIVTVIVTNMTNYRIFVFGRGAPAGVTTLTRETTLLELLSQLGSLDSADLENSYIVRDKKKIKSNFYDLFERGDFNQDMVLEPDDMLFIPDNFEKRISIVGAVNTPTTIPYREGLTILDVILSAGGFTDFAKENDVVILRRKEDTKRMEISVRAKDLMKGNMNENIPIKPGDVIVVKESLF